MGPYTNRYLAVLLHIVFFVSGISTILIGQVLPILSDGFGLNDLQAGYLFPAQFGGSILGTLLTNWFGRRNKFVLAAVIGCVAMAVGMTAMNLVSFEGCLAGFFVNGLGIGLTLPSINLLVLEMNPRKGASALSILNFCWGIGAIVCKPFVDATATKGSIFVTTLFLAVPLLAGAALIALLPRGAEMPVENAQPDLPDAKPVAIWTTALAWTIAIFNFVHIGFESGIGGWLTTYSDRLQGEPVVHLFSPTFLFFLFFVAGRGVAPIFFRFLTENQVLFLDIGLMIAGMLMILSAGSLIWLGIGAAISGFGASSVFPTNLSRFTRIFGPTATRRATPLFVSGTLGSAAVTWLIGFGSNQAGNLRAGMFALLACVCVLLVLQIVLSGGVSRNVGSER
jgi:MFS transporter, FHS family, glucose/mannose:H+ symporter